MNIRMFGQRLLVLAFCCWCCAVRAGLFHACASNAECQYRACLDRVGYVDTVPSWAQSGLSTYAQCESNASLGDQYVCQFSISFIDWSQGMGFARTEYGPCVPGPCLPGRYKVESAEIDSCPPCPEGTYNSAADPWARECTGCASGKYQARAGQSACDNCPAGTYGTVLRGTSASAACAPCPPGSYASHTGSTQCLPCILGRAGSYLARGCSPATAPQMEPCEVCNRSDTLLRECGRTAPTQCGATRCTPALLRTQPDYTGDWLTAEYKCRPGEYLRGFNTTKDKDCRRCPSGMVGLDGVKCEWCAGPLEEPYWLDQSSCVCKAGAVMNRTGGCECPNGWRFDGGQRACVACANNSYGREGRCYDCGAGNYSVAGATACAQCVTGKYRLHGQDQCRSCANASRFYAPLPWSDACVACNRSCVSLPGWRDAGPCPSGSGDYRVCAPCDLRLPNHSAWVGGGGCVYKCDAGYFFSEWDGGACKPCSAEPCPPGLRSTPCTEYADRVCDIECVNTSKPTFHSTWARASAGAGPPCPWKCEDGYDAVESDYWMFRLHECVPA